MPLFGRRSRPGLRLELPRPDGSGWPDPGRTSFAASTYLELGTRRAYEPEAHAVADRLVAAALPRAGLVVDPQDQPYLTRTFTVAARIGAGIGLVDREQVARGPLDPVLHPALDPALDPVLHPDIAGALVLARRGLPPMPDDRARVAGWLLLAGHRLGRRGPDALPELLAVL